MPRRDFPVAARSKEFCNNEDSNCNEKCAKPPVSHKFLNFCFQFVI